MNKPVMPASSLSLNLPSANRRLETYRLTASRSFPAKLEGTLNRVAFSAAHVVSDPLVDIEHALLGGVDQDRDDHFVELSRGPFEDIDVAQCHRIEGTRADGAAHDACRRRCSGGASSRAAARGTKR